VIAGQVPHGFFDVTLWFLIAVLLAMDERLAQLSDEGEVETRFRAAGPESRAGHELLPVLAQVAGLLAAGGVIWATNVIAFGLWYWDLDRGGAAARAHHPQANPAFIFPEMLHTQYVPAPWVPKFVDYLTLAFWTATAFSPTDISAVRPWAKLLMITEAAVSLGIAGLVIARAINILA
jgi:hypothetical protein